MITSAILSLSSESSSVDLAWTSQADVIYSVDYMQVGDTLWDTETASGTFPHCCLTLYFFANCCILGDNSALISGLENGKTYVFRVYGVVEGVSGPVGNEYDLTTAIRPQGDPTYFIPSATISEDTAALSWAPASFTGLPVKYNLLISTQNPSTLVQSAFTVQATNLTSTSYSISLDPGVVYYFEVQPLNDLGFGPKYVAC